MNFLSDALTALGVWLAASAVFGAGWAAVRGYEKARYGR